MFVYWLMVQETGTRGGKEEEEWAGGANSTTSESERMHQPDHVLPGVRNGACSDLPLGLMRLPYRTFLHQYRNFPRNSQSWHSNYPIRLHYSNQSILLPYHEQFPYWHTQMDLVNTTIWDQYLGCGIMLYPLASLATSMLFFNDTRSVHRLPHACMTHGYAHCRTR